MSKKKCKHDVIPTLEGLQRLKEAKSESEKKDNLVQRYTYEQLSRITCLDMNYVIKVLKRQGRMCQNSHSRITKKAKKRGSSKLD